MRTLYALCLDLVLVVVFAAAGRASHAEILDASGIASTAWPFLLAAVTGAVIVTLLRWSAVSLRAGALVWLVTLAGGMGLRVAAGGTTAVAFIAVAGISLALLLLGWRGIAALAARRSA
ncbi:MAG: DUF3054 domain-containing protein [Propionibacteriaceae bacterium]|nr:DUF3054 domain-containing protein [Propionibacteriaceae bacterium]